MATDFQSLLSSPNVACYSNPTPGEQMVLKLALLQQIALALNPTMSTDYQSLLNGPNVACFNNMPPGIQRLLELALLQNIAENSGSGAINTVQTNLTDGSAIASPFVLSQAPGTVSLVLHCNTADAASGLNPGDEIEATSVLVTATKLPVFSYAWSQSTKSLILAYAGTLGSSSTYGSSPFTSFSHFAIKAYYIL
jgi:hypothetical protein